MSKVDLENLEAKMTAARESRSRAMVVETEIYATILECMDRGADLRAIKEGLAANLNVVVGIIYEQDEANESNEF
jgi:hypothetical protein